MLNFPKIVMAINFFARQNSGKSIDKLDVLKLVYMADRYHMRKFGRPITGDSYCAMKLGPVPSKTRNVCDNPEYLTEEELDFSSEYLSIKRNIIHSKKIGEKDYFCTSEKEALNEAYRKAQAVKKEGENLPDFTHHFPEWKQYAPFINDDGSCCYEINMIDFFLPLEDDEKEYEYCNISERLLNSSKEEYIHSRSFEKFIGS